MRSPIIAIDAGHGGQDPGVVGPSGVRESDVALQLAKLFGTEIAKAGAEIILTRSDDTAPGFPERLAVASKADCLISIHVNGHTTPTANGFETIAGASHAASRALAHTVQQALRKDFPAARRDRGLKLSPSPDYPRRLWILAEPKVPSIIVEPGFLSNPAEETWLTSLDGQGAIAKALARGVWQWLRSQLPDLPEWPAQVLATPAENPRAPSPPPATTMSWDTAPEPVPVPAVDAAPAPAAPEARRESASQSSASKLPKRKSKW